MKFSETSKMQQEFVEGWNIEQILGEGAYGE